MDCIVFQCFPSRNTQSKQMPKKLTKHLVVRLSPDVSKAFDRKCEAYGSPSQVVRELVSAFLEDRLTIVPPTTRKSLYVSRSKN